MLRNRRQMSASSESPSSARRTLTKLGVGLLTAVGLASVAALFSLPLLAGRPDGFAVSEWGKFLGRFHPVTLHLPIGMLVMVILLELGRWLRRGKGGSTLVPMFFTAGASVLAALLGFLLYQGQVDDYPRELAESHLWWGLGFAAATVLVFLGKCWVDLLDGRGAGIYLGGLLACAGVMTVASHDGGSLTHGTGYLNEHLPAAWRGDEPTAGPAEVVEENAGVPLDERVVYDAWIQPMFDRKCVSCHGPDKQKGKLRMDSYELTLAGGKEGEGFEPGSAEDSNIVFRIELPEDDDEHMPPEGKKQMEPDEMAVLVWWLDQGASATAVVGELEGDEAVRAALERLAR